MLVAVESARSAVYQAGWTAAASSRELPVAAAMAKAVASEAYTFCAAETIQLHGGIGFTWEHDAHPVLPAGALGPPCSWDAACHCELLARRLGI